MYVLATYSPTSPMAAITKEFDINKIKITEVQPGTKDQTPLHQIQTLARAANKKKPENSNPIFIKNCKGFVEKLINEFIVRLSIFDNGYLLFPPILCSRLISINHTLNPKYGIKSR